MDKSSIKTHADVNVRNPDLGVAMCINSMMLHASASVQIDHTDVPTAKCLTMILVSAVALRYTTAQEGRDLIQANVNVSVLNPDHSVHHTNSLMTLHVTVSVQIDHQAVQTSRFSTTILANAVAHTFTGVLEDNSSITTHANVNVLNQCLTVVVPINWTILLVSVSVQIDQRGAPTIKLLITILVSAAVHTQSGAVRDRDSIQVPVDVSVLSQGQVVDIPTNLTIPHAIAFVLIDRGGALTIKYSTTILASANVPT